MENHRAILINVPIGLLKRLTEAATAMEVSRSELVRRMLKRDVEYILRQEVPALLAMKEQTTQDYSRWMRYN